MARLIVVCVAAAFVFASAGTVSAQPAGRSDIQWQSGPITGDLGTVAQIEVPAGFRFAGQEGAKRFLELTENPTSGNEMGVLLPEDPEKGRWFVVFEFNSIGYVKDDEKDKLDANAILTGIREGTEASNEERKRRGWGTMRIVGWHTAPFYDRRTNNLTWAINGATEEGGVVNYSVRLLGRSGVMNADLVLAPEDMDVSLPAFNSLIEGFTFKAGSRYAEFRQGDKVAAYGLTALVAGGAGAALAKSGLLSKMWKAIVLAIAGLFAAIKKFFSGGRAKEQPEPANS
jgi:uncharacterized membrane-anchored protein